MTTGEASLRFAIYAAAHPLKVVSWSHLTHVSRLLHMLNRPYLPKQLSCSSVCRIVVGAVAAATMTVALADRYPSKPIRVIVPSTPGGGSDPIARLMGTCLTAKLAQPIVVDNKGGANGLIAVQDLKRAPADGYTVMLAGMSQLAITPYIYKTRPYDVSTEFEPVSLLVSGPFILAASLPSGIKSFNELQSTVQRSNALSFASPGPGSPAHLISAVLAEKLNIQITHVPFQGEAAALTTMMSGEVQTGTFLAGTALQQITAGKVRALAVLGTKRLAELPDVPVITELTPSPELTRGSWTAFVVKTGTPAEAVTKLHAATQQCLTDGAVTATLKTMNVAPLTGTTPADVTSYVRNDTSTYKPIVERLGLRND